jgi:hypothetical protein
LYDEGTDFCRSCNPYCRWVMLQKSVYRTFVANGIATMRRGTGRFCRPVVSEVYVSRCAKFRISQSGCPRWKASADCRAESIPDLTLGERV